MKIILLATKSQTIAADNNKSLMASYRNLTWQAKALHGPYEDSLV